MFERPKTIITCNTSPDIPFDRSINPYRGCEHGCVYCYARPSHAYLGLSPGLDFESRLFAKPEAAKFLEQELSKPGYKPQVINIGATTAPYQPIERRHKITRQVLEVLSRPGAGTPGAEAGQAAGGDPETFRGRYPGSGDGGADDPGPQRRRAGADPGSRR